MTREDETKQLRENAKNAGRTIVEAMIGQGLSQLFGKMGIGLNVAGDEKPADAQKTTASPKAAPPRPASTPAPAPAAEPGPQPSPRDLVILAALVLGQHVLAQSAHEATAHADDGAEDDASEPTAETSEAPRIIQVVSDIATLRMRARAAPIFAGSVTSVRRADPRQRFTFRY